MPYDNPILRFTIPTSESDLATANTLLEWKPIRDITIVRVTAIVTTVLADFTIIPILSISLTTATVAIAEKDTITLADSLAVGTEVAGAETSMPFDVKAGETVTLAVKTAATGTTTGAVSWIIEYRNID